MYSSSLISCPYYSRNLTCESGVYSSNSVMSKYSLVPRRSNIWKERLVSTVRACVRIYRKTSVNAFVNELKHMARSSMEVVYAIVSGKTRQ